MSRLIIVSNRLPFSIDKSEAQPKLRQSSGGLVSALVSYFEKETERPLSFTEHIWIGSVDFSLQDWEIVKNESHTKDFSVEPIFVNEDIYENYYNGFSNSTLWPLFHYFPSLAQFNEEFYDAYVTVNRQFADKVLAIAQKDDIIWVHDYQLMLLPQMLRKAVPSLTIGYFLHIPFPSYEIFRLLPTTWKNQLLKGLLGADLLGFHTHDYARHFIQSCKMILKLDEQFNTIQYHDRIIRADLFPIGVDYSKFHDISHDKEVIELKNKVKEKLNGTRIIFSVDRLDYSKGLMSRLQGFQAFLENYPEWLEKVVYIFNIVPSRDEIPAYIERKKQIEEKISQLNGQFATMDWQPIIYRYNHVQFTELAALYQVADVALITPLRDGMNLVSKEFVASRSEQDGVLILSELAGAANELGEAVMVNPTDTKEVASAINMALNMPLEEQKERMQSMQKRLKRYDVVKWVTDYFDQLQSIKAEQARQGVKLVDEDALKSITTKFHEADSRFILLDYDGTLAPFTKNPKEAAPHPDVLALLQSLSDNPKNDVVIISGRDPETLKKWLGHLPIHLVGEHGGFIKPKNEDEWVKQTSIGSEWKEQIRPLLDLVVTRTTGSLMEEKQNTLAWHYRNTHPDLGFMRSRELLNSLLQLTANTPLQVIDGNKVLEVRLQGIDKGNTAIKLIDRFHPDFILCIGDDATDEDMFRVLNDKAVTVKIGTGGTAAQYNLRTQQEVLPFLFHFQEPKLQDNPVVANHH